MPLSQRTSISMLLAPTAVPASIGDCFPGDAMDRCDHRAGERRRSVVDGQMHRQFAAIGRRHLCHGPQIVERCRRHELAIRFLFPQRTDHRPHRRQRIATRGGDSCQGALGGVRLAVGDELGGLGLHDDARHVMGDNVVQFPSDGQPFLVTDLLSLFELTGVENTQVPAGSDDRTAGSRAQEKHDVGVETLVAPFDERRQHRAEGDDRRQRRRPGRRAEAPDGE